jgi:hypothetical protein
MRSLTGLLVGHHLHRRSVSLGGLMLLAAALDVAAAAGLCYVAGFHAVHTALARISWPWLLVLAGSIAASFAGYFAAYQGIYRVEGGPRLTGRRARAVVTAGFGGFLGHGGAALDGYALRAAGAGERDSRVRVAALAGLEHGVLGVLGTVTGIVVLTTGLWEPPADFTLPWAVLPVPGFVLAFWLAERYRGRLRSDRGWRGMLGVFLDAIHLNRELFLRPHTSGPAALGMAVFWVAEAFAMWAGLAAFGTLMNGAALFVGYATGMIFTRRTGPLAGAGVLMLVLPLTLWHSGAPLAVAVAGVFVYRVLSVWLPIPFALWFLPTLRGMVTPPPARAQVRTETGTTSRKSRRATVHEGTAR